MADGPIPWGMKVPMPMMMDDRLREYEQQSET